MFQASLGLPALLGAALLVGAPSAQTITRVTPAVASPGSVVILEGSGLAGTTELLFTGFVGGFAGSFTIPSPALSASATRVTTTVPTIPGWIPPKEIQGGSPFGQVRAKGAGFETANFPFYLLEGTGGVLANAGLGTTGPGGDRAAVSFDPGVPMPVPGDPFKPLGTGAPVPGNLACVLRLEAAEPGTLSVLVVGAPGPALAFGDGLIAVNPGVLWLVAPGTVVDGAGDASTPLPVPASLVGFGGITAQWGTVDAGTGAIELSSALLMTF
jgi:hypothetical protein